MPSAPFLLVLLALLTVKHPALAQTVADTAARADTSAARSDTATAASPTGDSLASKTADSTRGTKPDTGATAQRPAAPARPSTPPVDSAFKAACNPPPPNAPAASLLLVTFSPTLTERQLLEIANRVGGALVGVAATGDRYMRVSGGGSPRTMADSLIRYQGVTQVSERPCQAAVPSGR
jgi:hypothetical protein